MAGARNALEIYEGDDPLGFLLTRAVGRRYLDETQRALVAARVEELGHGGDRKSVQDTNLPVDRSAAAKMLNVSALGHGRRQGAQKRRAQACSSGRAGQDFRERRHRPPARHESVAAAALADESKFTLATIKALRESLARASKAGGTCA